MQCRIYSYLDWLEPLRRIVFVSIHPTIFFFVILKQAQLFPRYTNKITFPSLFIGYYYVGADLPALFLLF
jgi:hypothetical protein